MLRLQKLGITNNSFHMKDKTLLFKSRIKLVLSIEYISSTSKSLNFAFGLKISLNILYVIDTLHIILHKILSNNNCNDGMVKHSL